MRASRDVHRAAPRDVVGVEEQHEQPRLRVGRHLARLRHGVRLGLRRLFRHGRRLHDDVLERLDLLGNAVLLEPRSPPASGPVTGLPSAVGYTSTRTKFAAGAEHRPLVLGRLPLRGWPWPWRRLALGGRRLLRLRRRLALGQQQRLRSSTNRSGAIAADAAGR